MRRIKDTPSFFGALALLVVGTLISLTNLFYFYIDYFGDDIFMSRWWWEMVLNLQILCFASMWYAHYERLSRAGGGQGKRRAIMYFLAGMLAVSAPVVLLMSGVFTDWFRELSTRAHVIRVHYIFIASWLVSTLLIVLTKRRRSARHDMPQRSVADRLTVLAVKYWPGVLMLLSMLVGEILSVDFVYVLTPFLGYLQIALPGLRRAFRGAPDAEIPDREVLQGKTPQQKRGTS